MSRHPLLALLARFVAFIRSSATPPSPKQASGRLQQVTTAVAW
jgi:hypothetical protein